MRGTRTVVMGAALGALVLGVLAARSTAMTTFAGSCSWNGESEIYPPARVIPAPSGYKMSGRGTCTGTLDGAPFDGPVKVDVFANMRTPMGCAAGYSTQGGPFYITFVTGRRPPPPQPRAAPRESARATHRTHRKHRRVPRARRTRAHAAASDPGFGEPPPPPQQSGGERVLTTWTDEANVFPGEVAVDYWGAYRGLAVGSDHFAGDANGVYQCLGAGVPPGHVDGTFRTIEELRG